MSLLMIGLIDRVPDLLLHGTDHFFLKLRQRRFLLILLGVLVPDFRLQSRLRELVDLFQALLQLIVFFLDFLQCLRLVFVVVALLILVFKLLKGLCILFCVCDAEVILRQRRVRIDFFGWTAGCLDCLGVELRFVRLRLDRQNVVIRRPDSKLSRLRHTSTGVGVVDRADRVFY